MVTDSVADALIRIKNGYLAKRNEVTLSYSKLALGICKILVEEGYLASANLQDPRSITVVLKYDGKKQAVLREVKRISKPGLRVYKGKKALPYVLNGLGIALISTPLGVMSDKKARKEGVGGEILAYVW